MEIKEFDTIILKDGRKACIVEILSKDKFIADVGTSPADWDTIDVVLADIEKVI